MSEAWDIIIPEATTNIVKNPCAGTTGNLTAIGATAGTAVSRVTTYSYFGEACHRITSSTDNEGGYFTTDAAINDIHYVSLRINTASDVGTFDISMDNANWHDMSLLATEGDWWVYGAQIPAAQANASVATRIQQKGAGAIDLFIGHVQVEAKEYATTPVTGDLIGFLDTKKFKSYKWSGLAHSSSSTRSAQERSGGRVRVIKDTYSFSVRWASGIGMAPLRHITQSQALIPGAVLTGTKYEPRVLDLNTVTGTSYTAATVHSLRKAFINALKINLVRDSQPVVLRYRGANANRPVEFRAYYDTGMGFDGGLGFDTPVIRFICYDPFAYELGEVSAQLTTSLSISNADYIVKRIDGTWSNINTAFNGTVLCIARAISGNIYIGGSWAADVSTAGDGYGIGIIEYNPTTGVLTSLGTGLGGNKDVYDMLVLPSGQLVVTGDFLDAGGTANADYCAVWTGSAWGAIGTGLGGGGYAIALGHDGKVYFGGAFTNLTDANGDYITYWSGAAFVSMGTGMNGAVNDLVVADNGDLYAVGAFALAGGVANTAYVARWNGSAWLPLSTGLAGQLDATGPEGNTIIVDEAGLIYVGGAFATAGGVTCNGIAVWNGAVWKALGSGADKLLTDLAIDKKGILYAVGRFTSIGGITAAFGAAAWNGSTWTTLPFYLASALGQTLLEYEGDLYIGYNGSGTATSSYTNTITNNGTADAYPVVHIKSTGGTSTTVSWLKNETTDRTVYLDYDLQSAEELILDFRPGRRSITSSYFGDVWRACLRGSEYSEFYLQSGANTISVYVSQVGSPTMVQYMTWVTTHDGADGAAA